MKWICKYKDGVLLKLHVVPGASVDAIAGEHGEALKIRLKCPAVEGKANKALITLLSDWLNIPCRNIVIVSGRASRLKRIQISGIDETTVYNRMSSYMKTI